MITALRVAPLLAAISFGAAFAPGAASAALIYQNNTTYTFNGTSDVYIGDYGLAGATSATYVFNASATWAPNANVAAMLFNTAGGPNGPDLYFIQGYCGPALSITFNTYDNCGNAFSGTPSTAVNDGQLHKYAIVADAVSNVAKLYFDGVLEGTAGYRTLANNLTIGGDSSGFFWTGIISGISIYSTALTAGQVAGLSGLAASVAEPISLALVGVGLAGALATRRRKRAAEAA